jgi:hypothetical protein
MYSRDATSDKPKDTYDRMLLLEPRSLLCCAVACQGPASVEGASSLSRRRWLTGWHDVAARKSKGDTCITKRPRLGLPLPARRPPFGTRRKGCVSACKDAAMVRSWTTERSTDADGQPSSLVELLRSPRKRMAMARGAHPHHCRHGRTHPKFTMDGADRLGPWSMQAAGGCVMIGVVLHILAAQATGTPCRAAALVHLASTPCRILDGR